MRAANGVVAFAALLLAASCVRLSEQGEFACEADADCPAGNTCLPRISSAPRKCAPAGYCDNDQHCPGSSCERATQRCFVPECYTDQDCSPFTCSTFTRRCIIACSVNSECVAPFVCSATQCVLPLQDGAVCGGDGECASGSCCEGSTPGTKTCQAVCMVITPPPPDNMTCTTQADCAGQYCCPLANQAQKMCQATTCALGANGAACVSDSYCESGNCDNGTCLAIPLELGAVCTLASQCTSGYCCGSADDATRHCAEACEQLNGDPCTIGDECSLEGYCRNAGGGDNDGFCSDPCDPDAPYCGYNSNGLPNVCITDIGSACLPGCTTDADCRLIHPALSCFSNGTQMACDFAGAFWPE